MIKFLVAYTLIEILNGFNFTYKDEWDCLKKLLFSPDLISILTEMNEIHCDSKNIDFKTLFTHIEVTDEKNNNKDIESMLNFLDREKRKTVS